MEKIRAFIAIELPDEVKRALTQLQDKMKSGSQTTVRWTKPEDTHLTLQFLGDIDSALTGKITAAISEAVRGTHPFRLGINGMGVFPDPARVRIIWVGLAGDLKILGQLQKHVTSALTTLGFAAEIRPFTPHLTLGRVRDNAGPLERQNLGRLVGSLVNESESRFSINSVYLFKSKLTPLGPVHTRIGSVELK